ncbi:MAG: outer membrane protein transport protein [Bacteroidia bacterium]|nr:outer membrane protein transport protein [Bacteroidia bacterium]
MKKIFGTFLISCLILSLQAQNQDDIFRYSRNGISGSARTSGLAGAWGAVGADASAAALNPAGFGLYRRNEIMGAISVTSTQTNTSFLGNNISDGRTMINIPNIGLVFTWLDNYKGRDQRNGLVSATYAFGVNRLQDFQSNVQYSGNNMNTNVGNYFALKANGKDSTNFFSSDLDNELYAQAWRLVLIDNASSPNHYKSRQDLNGDLQYTVRQSQSIQTRGRINEWYAGGGLNFSNIIYLGASLVLKDVKYTSENVYNEDLLTTSLANKTYQSVKVGQSLKTTGTGVGGKFGLIIRPVDFIKIGIAYHTPVRLNLTDNYQNSISITNNNGKTFEQPGRLDYYKYQIVTPASLNLNAAITLGKLAVFAVDFETVNYSSGRLQSVDKFGDFSKANTNNAIVYGRASNIKGGVEFALNEYRFRAGYGLLGSPFNDSKVDGSQQLISGGFGWIFNKQLFFDLAVSDRIGKDYITAYEGNISAINTSHKLNFVFGGGYRF